MLCGRVVDRVWATKKSSTLTGQTFLTVEAEGHTLVCADCVGAGTGDTVLIATGSAARIAVGDCIPVDAAIIGIIDQS